jgi:hypothetical protein
MAAHAAEIDGQRLRAAQAELLGERRRLLRCRRDPDEAAAGREGAREVWQTCEHERGRVDLDAAAERRIRDDEIDVAGIVRARVGADERRVDVRGSEVLLRGCERGVVEIGAEQRCVGAEARALDELCARADERIPDAVGLLCARDVRERGGDGRM